MPSRSLAAAQRQAARLVRPTTEVTAAIGQRIGRAQRRLRPSDVRRKGVGDFVTSVDLACERALRRELRRVFPDAGFLGEETSPAELERDWVWVVDPIDGTSNFSRGLGLFAVSVALLHRGQPMLACLHCAPENAIYTAVHGRGARRNGRSIGVARRSAEDAWIVGCQWHRGQQDLAFVAALQRGGGRIRTFGSTVVQLADVATGRLHGNVQQQGRVWDIAAAGLVVEEAGGRFTDWRGRPVFPFADLRIGHTPTIAAGPATHRRIVASLRGCSAELVVPRR